MHNRVLTGAGAGAGPFRPPTQAALERFLDFFLVSEIADWVGNVVQWLSMHKAPGSISYTGGGVEAQVCHLQVTFYCYYFFDV